MKTINCAHPIIVIRHRCWQNAFIYTALFSTYRFDDDFVVIVHVKEAHKIYRQLHCVTRSSFLAQLESRDLLFCDSGAGIYTNAVARNKHHVTLVV